jgi:hypothetical protein
VRGLIVIHTMDYLYRGGELGPELARRLVGDLLRGFGAPAAPGTAARAGSEGGCDATADAGDRPGVALLAPSGCAHRADKPVEAGAAPRPVPVTVAAVEHRPVERTVEVTGTLKGWESVTIGSKRSGRVVQVFHDMGDRVKPEDCW